jgi:hypothetical protein
VDFYGFVVLALTLGACREEGHFFGGLMSFLMVEMMGAGEHYFFVD